MGKRVESRNGNGECDKVAHGSACQCQHSEFEGSRAELTRISLRLLVGFMCVSVVSLTWVILAGRPAEELEIFLASVSTSLFTLVTVAFTPLRGSGDKKGESKP